MHILYFVIFKKKRVNTSQEARIEAESLLNSENFCSSEGYFGGGKADWFIIGGRWSGLLRYLPLGINIDSKEEAETIWKESGLKEPTPYERNNHESLGYEDDAMIVDQKLASILQERYGDIEVYDADHYNENCIADIKPEDLIGRWLVVVDYHV